MTLQLAHIRERLARSERSSIADAIALRRAAVAVVLRDGRLGPEVLLIERAQRARDPWSGHMAFPGGGVDPGDASIEAAAIRETLEEVGLDLREDASPLAHLSDVQAIARGKPLPLAITPVVFELRAKDPPLAPNPLEVASILWVPLATLADGRHDGKMTWWLWGFIPMRLNCWRYDGKVIWGLTYRMLRRLLDTVA